MRKRRPTADSKGKRRPRSHGSGPAAPIEARGATTGRGERPRATEDLESVEDWPEEPDGDAHRWLIERRGEDVERDD